MEDTPPDVLAKVVLETETVRAKVCPACGGPLTSKVDPRQTGDTAVPGLWYNYRCVDSACGYFADVIEPVVPN